MKLNNPAMTRRLRIADRGVSVFLGLTYSASLGPSGCSILDTTTENRCLAATQAA